VSHPGKAAAGSGAEADALEVTDLHLAPTSEKPAVSDLVSYTDAVAVAGMPSRS